MVVEVRKDQRQVKQPNHNSKKGNSNGSEVFISQLSLNKYVDINVKEIYTRSLKKKNTLMQNLQLSRDSSIRKDFDTSTTGKSSTQCPLSVDIDKEKLKRKFRKVTYDHQYFWKLKNKITKAKKEQEELKQEVNLLNNIEVNPKELFEILQKQNDEKFVLTSQIRQLHIYIYINSIRYLEQNLYQERLKTSLEGILLQEANQLIDENFIQMCQKLEEYQNIA